MMFPQATSHGNILTFSPPGFKQSLNVKFPDSRLAVCEKCKKNFKTKDMCRVRNSHTDPPWTTAYVCITVDDSCMGDDGNFIDKPMTLRMVTWRPYAVRKPFHPKTPVCAGCKRTNRTRSFCRERHKHRQLPWCTVYVLLSALDQADPATVVAGPSKPVAEGDQKDSPGSQAGEDGKGEAKPEQDKDDSNSDSQSNGVKHSVPNGRKITDTASASSETISSDVDDTGDDINDIAESRTFLAKVNCKGSSVHWLDLAEFDDSTPPFASPDATNMFSPPAMTPPQLDPNAAQAHYYAHAHYAQQHQNALQSQQQYFFHMQQRQQQQYAQWQQQYAQQMSSACGDPLAGTMTAGDAAAAATQQRRQRGNGAVSPTAAAVTASPPTMQHQQPQHLPPWPYYAAPPAGFYSPPSALSSADQSIQGQEDPHAPPPPPPPHSHSLTADQNQNPGGNSEDEPDAKNSEDEPDAKRNRIV
ncbi:hypothetical protein ACA910_015185 [Epithemia clementina (nom. ined.)]